MTGITQRRFGINWRIIGWGGAVALLAVPFVAMRFTSEVNWTLGDFIFAAMMFGLVGLALELAVRTSSSRAWRAGAALGVLSAFLLVWINGAVGMIGDEDNVHNLLFLGLIPLALVGAILARFRAPGMALAMAVAGIAQMAIAAAGMPTDPRGGLLSLVMAGIWFLSAALFHLAGRTDAAR
jgi:hypothetical protein